jgi:hypothetical protein
MGSSVQQYLAEEERRNRTVKRIIIAGLALIIVAVAAYLLFRNYPEKQVVKQFLARVNAHDYDGAYKDWGCTPEHPCPNYDRGRFLEDWGPSNKATSPWKIASVDGCRTFVTVNVQAEGAPLQSLSVGRDHSLGFAPSPECQEKQWRWKQFFQRLIGKGSS